MTGFYCCLDRVCDMFQCGGITYRVLSSVTSWLSVSSDLFCVALRRRGTSREYFSIARQLFSATGSHFAAIGGGTWFYHYYYRYRYFYYQYMGLSLSGRIFNVYGARPYVTFLTSRTSSYVLFLLAAFLPFHISRYLRSRNFTLQLPLVHRTFNSLVILAIVTWSSTVTKFT